MILDAAAPTDLVPIFVLLEDPHRDDGRRVDFADVVNGDKGQAITNGFRYLTTISNQLAVPLERDLAAIGCTRTESFWLVTGVAADCVPDVVRAVAARRSVLHVEYDGPLPVVP